MRKFNTLINHEHPFRLLTSRIFVKIGISSFFIIDRKYYKIKFYPTSLSQALYINPNQRVEDENFFISYCREGDIVVDVGANIGTLTLLSASLVKKNGKVFSFEPHPRTYEYLLKNITLNKFSNIETFCYGVGDKDSVFELTDFSDAKSDDTTNYIIPNTENVKTTKIKVSCLDNLLPSTIKRINLLKIDTEGYELFVLRGAENILDKTDCIYYESYEPGYNRFGYKTQEVSNLLNRKGFKIFRVVGKSYICEIKDLDNYISYTSENLIAVKDIEVFIKRTGYKLER
jgi:FkbM family methyltransferase